MAKRKGYFRIFVVISIIWICLAAFVQRGEFIAKNIDGKFVLWHNPLGGESDEQKKGIDQYNEEMLDQSPYDWRRVFKALAVTISLPAGLLISFFTLYWIVVGFRNDDEPN